MPIETQDFKISLKADGFSTKTLATIEKTSLTSMVAVAVDGVKAFVHATAEKNNRQQTYTGYVEREVFDSLNVSTVPIPQNFAGLEAVDVPTRLQEQLFRIYEVEESEDYVTIHARHVWYDNLQNYTTWEPTEETQYSGAAVCRNILSNAISPVDSNVASDSTDTKPGSEFDYARKNIVECFLDPENGVCAKFGLSLIRYNWDFYCLKNVGYDRGYVIQDKKNLLGVVRTESIENLATRIVPIGMDKQGEIVWLNNNGLRYVDSQYINDYSKPRVELYDTGLRIGENDVTAENINEKLLQAAQRRFTEDKVDLPEITMTINFLSIGDTEEYVQYRGLDKVYLFDIVTIRDTTRGYAYSAQVVAVEHDILTGMLTSITLGTINNSDGVRKIATWQVPEVSGENIRLKTIMAGAFQPGAINYDDLATGAVGWIHINAASISQLTTEQLTALQANIHELIAGSLTADDIQANSITAAKIAAGAITAEKLAAAAVTADKLAAGSVTAAKIDVNDLSAIHATLGTAAIADARIAVADIDYAKVKDLAADTAIFSTTITDQGVADRLYINRLLITYSQMVEANIGDLVIGASDGNYYHVDVEWTDGVPSLVPTQVQTPTAAEIEAGHTAGGQTIIGDVGTYAELCSEDFYAINAIIDRITAKRIDVDELWAREAFVGKLMVTDITANPTIGVIKSQIGDWAGGSTITQTINSLSTRISQLGYGAIFYSETEPPHDNLNPGDIWIEPIEDNTWDDIAQYTWDELASMTWDQVAGQYRMYCWTGDEWKILFDNLIVSELTTEIQQTAYAVTLKADKSLVDTLSGQVSEFSATLEVQAEQIQSAVSAVNAKTANYTRLTDPSTDSSISLHAGDTWTKAAGDGTWDSLAEYTWDELAELTWDELAGASVYTWDGTKWIQTSDYGATLQSRTLITQTADAVETLAQKTDVIDGQLTTTRAQLTVANDRITQEVSRATAAENNRIEKTSQYQTAESIVTEAVRQSADSAGGLYVTKTTTLQTAESIVTEAVRQSATAAGNTYLAKTSTYQTAESIVTEAVRQSGTNASRSYIAKTSTFQTADSIVTEAVTQAGTAAASAYIAKTSTYQTAESIVSQAQSYTNGKLSDYSTTTQTSTMISNYVTNNAYKLQSGVSITAEGVDVSGSKHVRIESGSQFRVKSSGFGVDSTDSSYVMWAGAATAANSKFRVTPGGRVTLTELAVLNEAGTAETTVNLRSIGVWWGSTIRSYEVSGGSVSSMKLSNGETINFKNAASFSLDGYWSGGKFNVDMVSGSTVYKSTDSGAITSNKTNAEIKADIEGSSHQSYVSIENSDGDSIVSLYVDARGVYTAGETAGYNSGYERGEHDGYTDGYAEGVNDGYSVGYDKGADDEAAKYTSHTGFLRGSDVVARAGGTVQTLTPINANQKVTVAGTTYYAAGTPLSVVVGAGAATTYYTSGNYLTYYTKDAS